MYEKSKIPDKLKKNTRVKATLACTFCQYRKIKCSGVKPCTNCIKHQQDCHYVNLPIRRGPRKVDVEIIFCKEKRVADAHRAESYQKSLHLMTDEQMNNSSQENVVTTNLNTSQPEIASLINYNNDIHPIYNHKYDQEFISLNNITQIPQYPITEIPLNVNTEFQIAGVMTNPLLPPRPIISMTGQYINLPPISEATSTNKTISQNNFHQMQTPQFSFNPNLYNVYNTNSLESDFRYANFPAELESYYSNTEIGINLFRQY
ncbi:8968_t:CDS:1 [Diversispora eburnea]|uniref:8968_t:CDS:1 n=1 Tax=Diversispora eburnea TaxID=1213867 RepID=A0A9N8WLI9_9GLOM|nr:8968_t:CDS:1 [Diversispora eburnea]